MKKPSVIFLYIFFTSFLNFYSQKMPSDYFEEGLKQMEQNNYRIASSSFKHIVDHNPKNELYPKAFYNLGYIYFLDKKYDSAVVIFTEILMGNFNETESSGGGLMDDPYTNYKHRASEILSEIYEVKKMYEKALSYFALSDTLYPYLHFCGNEYDANTVHKSLRYSELYLKINQNQKAIEFLLHAVFVDLVNNSEVLEKLKTILIKEKFKNLKQDLDSSISKMYSKVIKGKTKDYIKYYLRFLNTEIEIPFGYNGDDFDKKKAIQQIEKSSFYVMITKM